MEENLVFPRILIPPTFIPSQNSQVICRDIMRVPAKRNWVNDAGKKTAIRSDDYMKVVCIIYWQFQCYV